EFDPENAAAYYCRAIARRGTAKTQAAADFEEAKRCGYPAAWWKPAIARLSTAKTEADADFEEAKRRGYTAGTLISDAIEDRKEWRHVRDEQRGLLADIFAPRPRSATDSTGQPF
ncbi:MAG: hypothetical protein ABR915_24150, partial [Thermoguttaceae bacterium]